MKKMIAINKKIYWGDLHSHCSISYGEGKLESAIQRAAQQLDFCSITGHAFWHDMNQLSNKYVDIKKYHKKGFLKLKKNWPKIIDNLKKFEKKYTINIFPSYEWHSLKFGDHNIYSKDFNLKLKNASNLQKLKKKLTKNHLIIPHHIGYGKNFRGINWNYFSKSLSPFVEIFSMHGCSIDEKNSSPMLHEMGTLSGIGTAEYGWKKNFKFGVIGSTDHHGGYPGSYGDGMVAAIAEKNTKEEIWKAFKKRNVYALTGDKINLRFTINDQEMGSEIKNCKKRIIKIKVNSMSSISHVILFKNDMIFKLLYSNSQNTDNGLIQGSIRLSWGWGRKNKIIKWNGKVILLNGTITRLDSCFRGIPKLDPDQKKQNYLNVIDLPHKCEIIDNHSFKFTSITSVNYSLKDPGYQSINFKIKGDVMSKINLSINDRNYQIKIREIIKSGSKVIYPNKWLNELIKIGPFNNINELFLNKKIIDNNPLYETDRYRVEEVQHNGHRARSSPIWVTQ